MSVARHHRCNVYVHRRVRQVTRSERAPRNVLLRRIMWGGAWIWVSDVSSCLCECVSERRWCTDEAGTAETVSKAYAMCANQPNAAPETHATLIATLIVGSGSIVVASPTATPITRTSSQSSKPTASTPLSTSSTSASSSTATPAAVSTSSSTATSEPDASRNHLTNAQIGGLAGGLVAVAVLAAIVAVVLVIRRRRGFARMQDDHAALHWTPSKRSHGSPGTGSTTLPISQPRYHEPKSMSFTRALAKRMSGVRKSNINNNNSSSQQGSSSTVGLAISPGVMKPEDARLNVVRNIAPSPPPAISPQRALSSFKFGAEEARTLPQEPLPAKLSTRPTLTVAILNRDSVVTEFAEDGEEEENTTSAKGGSGNNRLSIPGSAKIWRPPTTGPLSAATYYVADRWGNWVLGGARSPADVHELATPISKTVEERNAVDGDGQKRQQDGREVIAESGAVKAAVRELASSPPNMVVASGRHPHNSGVSKTTIRLVTPDSGRLPVNSRSRSRSSSDYSEYPSTGTVSTEDPPPLPTATAEAFYIAGPDGSMVARGNSVQSHRKKRQSNGGRITRDSGATVMSQDSATTIADSPVVDDDVGAFPLPLRRSQFGSNNNLSPVVESPGNSPVRYPAIPQPQSNPRKRPQLNPAVARVRAQPEFSDSPTLGMVGGSPRKTVRVNSAEHEQPSIATTPSSARISYYHPAPLILRNVSPNLPGDNGDGTLYMPRKRASMMGDRALLPSQQPATSSRYGPMSIYDAYNDPSQPSRSLSTAEQQDAELYGTSFRPPPRPYQVSPQQQRYEPSPPTRENTLRSPPSAESYLIPSPPSDEDSEGLPFPSSETDPSVIVTHNGNGSSSSLLAKRLGAERAAEFQIEGARSGKLWAKRSSIMGQGGGGGTRTLTPPKGMAIRTAAQQGSGGSDRGAWEVQLPATPGWKPQLTPKKRGDDLYLSVG